MSLLWPLQTAVYSALTAHGPLMAVVTGVHDGQAPQDEPLPYVVVGSSTEVPSNTLARTGWSDTLTIHVWSEQNSRKEALEILGLIDDALAGQVALSGHDSARLKREFADVLIDPDGTRHVPARYRVTTREAA